MTFGTLEFWALMMAIIAHVVVIARWSSRLSVIQEKQESEISLLRQIVAKSEQRIARLEGSLEGVIRDLTIKLDKF